MHAMFRNRIGLVCALMVAPLPLLSRMPLATRAERTRAEAPRQADSAAVAEVVERFHAALAAGDSAAALAPLAPDVTILESGGVETLQEYRAHHLAGDIAFAQAVPRTRAPILVRVAGAAAWATSSGITQGEYRGRAVNSSSAELMVLTRSAGGWVIRAIHWSSRSRR